MKNPFKVFALAIILSGFAASVSAQVTVNAPAHAVIVQTITLVNNYPLHFGDLAVTTTGGTCVLTAMSGTPTRAVTGGVTLPASIGTPMAAEFYVTGVAAQNYIISIPQTDLTITNTTPGAGPNTMIVNTYTTDKTIVTPSTWRGVLTGGTSTFYVGGTCNVLANQSPGLYQNLVGFPVTVNYE